MRYSTPIAQMRADERHRAGLSCRTVEAYVYDADGYERWCIDCGAPLVGEAEPASARSYSNLYIYLMALITLAIVIGFYVLVNSGVDRSGPPVTPTPYGNPAVVHSAP